MWLIFDKHDSYKQKLVYWIIFWLQFEEFALGPVSIFRVFILPASLLGFIKVLKENVSYKEQRFFIFSLLWLAFANIITDDLVGCANKILLIPFVYFFVNCLHDTTIKVRFDKAFMIGAIVNFASFFTSYAQYIEGRFCGIHFDPNFLCVTILISFVSTIVYYPTLTNKYSKAFYLFIIVIDLFMIFISQSRGALIALFLVGGLFVFGRIKNIALRILLLCVGGLVFLQIYMYTKTLTMWSGFYDNPVDQILSRFNDETGSGREDLWTQGIKYISINGGYIIPAGANNMLLHMKQWSHNSYIDMCADSGYLFFAYFFINYLLTIKNGIVNLFRGNDLQNIECTLLGIIGAIVFAFLSYYTTKTYWLLIIMLFCAQNSNKK